MHREHRCCARQVLDREIMIGYPPYGFIRARVRNISLGGLCVETAAPLAINRRVELLFHTSADNTEETHRWQATVTHAAPSGVGLKFDPFVLTELTALLGLLQAADRQAMDKAKAWNQPRPGRSTVPAPPVPALSSGPRPDGRTSEYQQR